MLEPLKLGLPLGFLFTLLLAFQVHFELLELTMLRWLVVGLLVTLFMIYRISLTPHVNSDFKVIWFTGFTLNIASQLVFGAVTFLMSDLVFAENLTRANAIYFTFYEVISQMTIALIVITIVSGLYKLKRKP